MHAVEIQNGRALASFQRTPAWHVLGQVEEFGSPDEGFEAAGLLDWNIFAPPVFVQVDGQMLQVDNSLGQVFVRNTANGIAPLSMVGNSTLPHQNEDLLEFAKGLLSIGADSDNPVEFEAAGSLQDGRRVWVLLKIPGTFEIGGDTFARWLCVETSHDGKGATRAFVTYIRVVCWNTLSAASNAATNKYVIPHLRPISGSDISLGREVLGLHLKVDPVLTDIVSAWQDESVSEAQWEAIVKNIVPDAPALATDRSKRTVLRKRAIIDDLYFTSPTIGSYRGTKWGAVNALTEAYQWAPGSQTSAESLAKRQLVGAAVNERAAVRAVDAVLAGI